MFLSQQNEWRLETTEGVEYINMVTQLSRLFVYSDKSVYVWAYVSKNIINMIYFSLTWLKVKFWIITVCVLLYELIPKCMSVY